MKIFKITINYSEDYEVQHESKLDADNHADTIARVLAANSKRVLKVEVKEVTK